VKSFSENPLLQGPGLSSIESWLADTAKLAKELRRTPIPAAGGIGSDIKQRRHLISGYKSIFVPAPQPLHIADRMLNVISQGLQERNPHFPEVQRWVNLTQQWHGRRVEEIPWNPIQAKGMILEGITGIGKSHIVERVLSLLPQTVDHQPNGEWGMLKLRQLVWLKVAMPANHTRTGLLVSILAEMDRVLETQYYSSHVRATKRIDTLIVAVMQLLVQHRCGMLIIEEAQEDNLGSKVFSRDFLSFFLRILNWGIPILIVGNPLSFRELSTHAQDVDRFSEGGWFTMLPEMGPDSKTWTKLWIPGLWNPSVLDLPDAAFSTVSTCPEASDWSSFLWQLTGGLPRHLARLREDVMDWALRNNVSQVSTDLVMKVFLRSPRFSKVQLRNKALANHDVKSLMDQHDLPIEQLRDYWQSNKQNQAQMHSQVTPSRLASISSDCIDSSDDAPDPKESKLLAKGIVAATKKAVEARNMQKGRKDSSAHTDA